MGFSAITNMFFLIIGAGIVVVGLLAVKDIMSGVSLGDLDDSPARVYSTFALYDDFPEYSLNRSNVADAINYNPKIQQVLMPYKKIGFKIGLDEYTLHVASGKYQDITLGIDADVDFTASLTREEFNTMVADAKHRDIGHLLSLLITADIPASVKAQALAAAKS